MRKLLVAIFFGVFLNVGAGMESAQSADATFKLTNNAPHTIQVKLFSQTRRGWQWPSSSRHWTLDDGREHSLTAGQCQPGEKICFGGSYDDNRTHWGVGLSGKRACQGCCITCGETHAWNLNGGSSHVASRPSRGQIIDHGPELVPAEE